MGRIPVESYSIGPEHSRAVAELVRKVRHEHQRNKLGVSTTSRYGCKSGASANFVQDLCLRFSPEPLQGTTGQTRRRDLSWTSTRGRGCVCFFHYIFIGNQFFPLTFPVTYQGDSTFRLIKEELCITTANMNELDKQKDD